MRSNDRRSTTTGVEPARASRARPRLIFDMSTLIFDMSAPDWDRLRRPAITVGERIGGSRTSGGFHDAFDDGRSLLAPVRRHARRARDADAPRPPGRAA